MGADSSLTRKIEADIAQWISVGTKALLVDGVRQCGKTFTVRKCLNDAACDFIEYNLIKQPEVLQILENATGIDDIILKLSLYSEKKIISHKTVFFIDEIQLCKEFVTKIKFLVDDGRYRFILSGSLLGVEITALKSAPVGYLSELTMYPLDFEEFLQIFGPDASLTDILRNSFKNILPLDDVIHKRLKEWFNLYLIIGGMPAAVAKFKSGKPIDDVIDEHLSIMNLYKLDFTKYESENRKLLLSHIYDMIPGELNSKNNRFMIADINKNLRYERISDSFIWLYKAGVALGVFNVTEPVIPLLLNRKSSLFKLFLSDVGLLTTMYGRATKLAIINDEHSVNKGAIYENAAAQELKAHGFELYYFNSKKSGEIDFVTEHNGEALPIEIKSGKSYDRHSALNNVLNKNNYSIAKAYVFGSDNIRSNGKIAYFPIYMLMCLHHDDINFPDISVKDYMNDRN